MGDEQSRAPAHDVAEGGVDGLFDFGVDGARGVVEQEYTGFVQECSGKRNALALAAGQREPPLADDRLVPVRELLDEIVCPRRSGGGLDLGIGRVRTAKGDVRPHRR